MPTITSLPVELLEQILHLAGAEPFFDTSLGRTSLANAALVCRGWRQPAQRVLWEDVYLWQGVVAFHAGTVATEMRTRRLRLAAVDVPGAGEAVRACRGLRELVLCRLRGFDMSALCVPELSGLKHLDINGSTFLPSPSPVPPFSFHLSSLTLDGTQLSTLSLSPSHFLQPSLTSLELKTTGLWRQTPAEHAHLNESLLPLAPNLLTLRLSSLETVPFPKLDPFFSLLTSLQHLETHQVPILALIPTRLKSWKTTYFLERNVPAHLEALRSGTRALEKLEKLVCLVKEMSRPREAVREESWRELREECEGRGIVLEVRSHDD